jgi:hypothetical protein
MLSLYNPDASISDRIEFLKKYETYDPTQPANEKLIKILFDIKKCDASENSYYMDKITDAILYTRNIRTGRGLRDLTYSYLFTMHQFVPMQSVFTLYIIVGNADDPIGSWRDVRSYCEFLANHSANGRNDAYIKPVICLYNNQLQQDNKKWIKIITDWESKHDGSPRPDARNHISYAAKWVPRESKGRQWMFDILVSNYKEPDYVHIMKTAKTPEAITAAERKCKMMYRKMVTNLNRELDTIEVKQCANQWAKIEPSKVSDAQLYNVANAFLNTSNEDRMKCASTFTQVYNEKMDAITQKKYSYDVPVWKLVKHMVRLIREEKTEEINAMNAHWQSYVETRWNNKSDYYIAILDVSESMYENGAKDLYTAIGMGCAVASKSHFGQKVLVFTHKPEWVDLSLCTFSEMIQRIMTTIWSSYTSVEEAFKMVLDAVVSANMTPDDVENLKIQLYTNKQVDYENIFEMWRTAGTEKFGKPFVLGSANFEKMVL